MGTKRWSEVAAIVEKGLALPPESRLDYVRAACGDGADLGRQVQSLLLHHQDEETFHRTPAGASRPGVPPADRPAGWVPDRFERLEFVGTGGFGNVFKAFDRVRGHAVALKVLRLVDPVRLDRFKQEFRKTTTIAHRNVVRLHELFSDGDQWFFTMELVEGVPMLDYIRGPGSPAAVALAGRAWLRLRETFEQLVQGVAALHAAGIVHGDLKPQNVLVNAEGRVVLLDFGLVREIAQQSSQVAGTPAYMAPEQLAQAPVAEAADWYGVGVLLYEALSGRVPFAGTFWDVLWKKQGEDARLPSLSNVPEALASLCEALLQRQPEQRPAAGEILARLVGHRSDDVATPVANPQHLFVGRQRHLDVLHDAFARVESGHPTTIHLRGVSGIGKSTLVRRFLDTIRLERKDAVVLAGRCYESESVPFKALDELVDGLSRYLGHAEASEVDALLPRDLSLLTRVFPALRRVPGVATPQRQSSDATGAQQLRDRALHALHELLERLAARKPVVLWIDDLQWGDFDSLRVLRDLQQPSRAPCLLLLLSYRSEDAGISPVLRALTNSAEAGKGSGTVRELVVDELRGDEARELAAALCGSLPEAERAAIVDEAAGSPLFLQELIRHVTATSGLSGHAATLSGMIRQRVQQLRPPARRLLDVIAVAGKPLERHLALREVCTLETSTLRLTPSTLTPGQTQDGYADHCYYSSGGCSNTPTFDFAGSHPPTPNGLWRGI